MHDDFGTPDRMLGGHPDWFYPALGRVVAVCALLETRVQSLAEILAHMEQGTLTQKPNHVLRETAAAAVQMIDSANEAMQLGPIGPRVNEFYAEIGEILDRRHAVVHAVWPAQPGEAQFGHRPGRLESHGEVRIPRDNTQARMSDLIGKAVAMVGECGILISTISFAVSRALEAGYRGIKAPRTRRKQLPSLA